MFRIVFIGYCNNERLNILNTIDECKIDIIHNYSNIIHNLPNDVIDLFIISTPNTDLSNKISNEISKDKSLNHIPIIILTNDLEYDILSDLVISDNISDKEFLYQVKTLLKMKLMDDELKKEKILLEFKVKSRTLQLEDKANSLNITLNSIGDGVIVTDKNGLITLMNPVAKEITKLNDSEFMLNHIDEVLDISYKNKKIYIFDEVMKSNKTFFIKDGSELKSKNSETIKISDSASLILNKKNDINGIVIVFRDITCEYELRKKTIESEKKYKRIYYHVPDVVYTMSIDGKFTSMNDSSIFGYSNDEIIGTYINKYVPYDNDMNTIIKNINLKIDKINKITQYKIHIRKKDGKIVPIDVKTQIVFDDDGNPLEIFGIVRDISEREEINRLIKENQERYRNMFENMNSGVWVLKHQSDDNFYIIDWNKKSEIIDNIELEKNINKNIFDIFPYLNDDKFKESLNYVWKTGDSMILKNYKICLNKETYWRKFFIYKLNTTNEIIIIVDDITELKNSELKLKEEKERAEESDRLKSVFLANMSHEIRTPMNSIIGFSDMLTSDIPKEKVEYYISIIKSSGNLLLTLIEDIIDLSKIQSGNLKISKDIFSVNDLIKHSDEEFKKNLKDKNKNNDIIFKIDINDDIIINSDQRRIKQIINNLVGNSIKFTKEGEIKLGYYVDGDFVVFYVKDTGIGISDDNILKIYDRFFQVENRNEKKQEGTGLGLTITKAIVELLGGEIWLDSTLNKGTNFYFSIPIGNNEEENKLTKKTKLKNIIYDWSDKNIFIIEDDEESFKLYDIILTSSKIKITRTKLNNINNNINNTYDLVILNVDSLQINSIINIINDIKKYNNKIILVSKVQLTDNDIKKLKVNEVFIKPLNWYSLLDIIDKYLSI
ncbi:MAG: PAS domain S-box protein [Saccharofermentanales bacterium]